jgi:hypothetical protein
MEDVRNYMEENIKKTGAEKNGLETENTSMKQELVELRRQLRDFNERPVAQPVENSTALTAAINTALEELKNVDQERITYKIRYEYETRIMNIEKNSQRQINEFKKVSE